MINEKSLPHKLLSNTIFHHLGKEDGPRLLSLNQDLMMPLLNSPLLKELQNTRQDDYIKLMCIKYLLHIPDI